MKIALDYEPNTGMITTTCGLSYCWNGLEKYEIVENNANVVDVETLVKLKNAGFETDDIIELRKKEII